MAASILYEYEAGTGTAVLTTELNALANSAQADGAATLDNTGTAGWTHGEVEINLSALSPAAGGQLALYVRPSMDGTNFADAKALSMEIAGTFPLDTTAATAQRVVRTIPLHPGISKFSLVNLSGGALGATGSTVKVRRLRMQTT